MTVRREPVRSRVRTAMGVLVRSRVWTTLNQPADIAWLCAVRFLFGCVLCFASLRFLAKGWVNQLLIEPEVHFAYAPWLAVRPLPSALMHGVFVLMAVLALGVALGFFYRVCSVGFLLTFLYVELIDKALYLNHYYLVTLVAWLLVLAASPARLFPSTLCRTASGC